MAHDHRFASKVHSRIQKLGRDPSRLILAEQLGG
jgi:hypothetical protein